MTEARGREIIQNSWELVSMGLSKTTAIVRLFAISQIFYRQPVGDEAGMALHDIMGVEETKALFFLCGCIVGASHNPRGSAQAWEDLLENVSTKAA